MPNPIINQFKLPTGNLYDIQDSGARELIEALQRMIEGGVEPLGVTTTELTDGSTTNPVVIDGESVTAKNGNLVFYDNDEFVWSGTENKWRRFGPAGTFRALAYKDSASGDFTPMGNVSQPEFHGVAATLTDSDVTITGDVSKPTFTGAEGNVSVSGTPNGSVAISEGSGTANYTPGGLVSTPTITVTPNTSTVAPISSVGSLPSLQMTVTDGVLEFSWDAGTLPEKGTDVSVVTGIASATSTQPTFTGTPTELKASFTGSSTTMTGKFTPEGDVSKPTFVGNDASVSISYTPAGTVDRPTFTGTQDTITVS